MTNSEKISLRLKQLPNAEGLPSPAYQSDWAAGFDMPAALLSLDNGDEHIIIPPGEFAMVPTGHALELPQGYEAQLRPRSGLAAKNGVTVLNTPGTIDADYRGEIKAILINHGKEPFTITHGMRIAQMVIQKLPQVEITMTDELNETDRAANGFGSTGTK